MKESLQKKTWKSLNILKEELDLYLSKWTKDNCDCEDQLYNILIIAKYFLLYSFYKRTKRNFILLYQLVTKNIIYGQKLILLTSFSCKKDSNYKRYWNLWWSKSWRRSIFWFVISWNWWARTTCEQTQYQTIQSQKVLCFPIYDRHGLSLRKVHYGRSGNIDNKQIDNYLNKIIETVIQLSTWTKQ